MLENCLHFSSALRLLRQAEFQAVFDNASLKIDDASFLLLIRGNDFGHPRIGLAIAKKKIHRSVDRNRLKRQVRNSFRLHQKRLPAVDIIFLARHNLSVISNPVFRAALEQAWGRLNQKYMEAPSKLNGAK